VHLAREHAFALFEYYLTDKAGHSQSSEEAAAVLASLDRFFAGLLTHFDPGRHLLVVTSDHGNLEDLSTKSHTRNPVPLVAYGHGAHRFAAVDDLTGVTPSVLAALRHGRFPPSSTPA
jgi:2,3-bisphosphoglycerate-independent phosphoglycerate mutase